MHSYHEYKCRHLRRSDVTSSQLPPVRLPEQISAVNHVVSATKWLKPTDQTTLKYQSNTLSLSSLFAVYLSATWNNWGGFMTYNAAQHQRAIKTLWLHFQGADVIHFSGQLMVLMSNEAFGKQCLHLSLVWMTKLILNLSTATISCDEKQWLFSSNSSLLSFVLLWRYNMNHSLCGCGYALVWTRPSKTYGKMTERLFLEELGLRLCTTDC